MSREFLFAEAVPNFDATPDRAQFAKRMYLECADNSDYDYRSADSMCDYDKLALQSIARTMGISAEEVVYLLE